ncbi:MAG: ATP-binding protein [Acidobacteriia bacterium]|nr:ATP-binding protein [Terriglobia bacterium]
MRLKKEPNNGRAAAMERPAAGPAFTWRIRVRAQRRVLWMRSLWANGRTETEHGLVIPDSEIDRILTDPAELREAEALFYENDSSARELAPLILAADAAFALDPPWAHLQQAFELSQAELDLLSLTVAVEVDPMLRRVYGYLHDDATAGRATPWLAAALFESPLGVSFGPDCNLIRWRIASPADNVSDSGSVATAWVADPGVVQWLTRLAPIDPMLGSAAAFIPAAENATKTCLYPAELARMQAFVAVVRDACQDSGDSCPLIELELVGPDGSGRETLAGQLAAALGCNLVSADAALLMGSDVPPATATERAVRAARLAKLVGGVLYWRHAERANPNVWDLVMQPELTIFGSQLPLSQTTRPAVARLSIRLPRLTRDARLSLWTQLSDSPAPEPITDWTLVPAEIVNAARVEAAGADAVANVCRGNLHQGPHELLTPMLCPYTWNDIVLPAGVRQHLGELEQQARLRWPVYEDWGFEKLVPMGRGITAMFAGPSGTGKTMAAQVMAASLGMKLYRVDLAGVMNKYIGETEKHLKQVFESCERTNVVLLFDEADALFGQRTQVKDAHDRFANIEIDYLLQRMEQFDGIAILATNRKGDLDKAFVRRLRFIVDFIQPGPAERLALWKRALLAHSPRGEALLQDIDWDFLAGKLNMSGADITLAALSAAFLARAEGSRITMNHVLNAARREVAKHGVMLRPGDWEG